MVEGRREDLVRTLQFEPGTLSVFRGNRSLHGVTPCVGPVERLVAIFTFATVPGFRNSANVQEIFWGKRNKYE